MPAVHRPLEPTLPRANVLMRLLLVAVVLTWSVAAWEGFWRNRGWQPSPDMDARLWALNRIAVDEAAPDTVVIGGTSRAFCGIQPPIFSALTGRNDVHQLAIPGGAPWPVLNHFAEDSEFRGLLVLDVGPQHQFGLRPRESGSRIARWHVQAYEKMKDSLLDRVEAELRVRVQSLFVSRLPDLAPKRLYQQVLSQKRPLPVQTAVTTIKRERFLFADVQPRYWIQRGNSYARQFEPAVRPVMRWPERQKTRELANLARWVEARIQKIRNRGGEVVLLQPPLSGRLEMLQRRFVPRKRYWNNLARNTSAISIHYEDVPAMRRLKCVDQSHLDAVTAQFYTDTLVRVLRNKLRAAGSPQQLTLRNTS